MDGVCWDLSRLSVEKQLEMADKHDVLHVVSLGVKQTIHSGQCSVCGIFSANTIDFVTDDMPMPLREKLIQWYPMAERSPSNDDPNCARVRFRACAKHARVLEAVSDHMNQMQFVDRADPSRDMDVSMCFLARGTVDSLFDRAVHQ